MITSSKNGHFALFIVISTFSYVQNLCQQSNELMLVISWVFYGIALIEFQSGNDNLHWNNMLIFQVFYCIFFNQTVNFLYNPCNNHSLVSLYFLILLYKVTLFMPRTSADFLIFQLFDCKTLVMCSFSNSSRDW